MNYAITFLHSTLRRSPILKSCIIILLEYRLVQSVFDWADARDYCEHLGGELAQVFDETIHQAILCAIKGEFIQVYT